VSEKFDFPLLETPGNLRQFHGEMQNPPRVFMSTDTKSGRHSIFSLQCSVQSRNQSMMSAGLENALPIDVRREQGSYVEPARGIAARQQEFELRIESPRKRGNVIHFNLRCCGQTSFLVD
jgi:hypothetical protein